MNNAKQLRIILRAACRSQYLVDLRLTQPLHL